MKIYKISFIQSKIIAAYIVFVIWHIFIAWSVRPNRDDYFTLGYQTGSLTETVIDYYLNWTGYIANIVLNYFIILPSRNGFNWVGFFCASMLSAILVHISVLTIFAWLKNTNIKELHAKDIYLAILATLGFEGVFTPGILSAFYINWVFVGHLLPVCSLILGIYLTTQKKSHYLILVILGFLAANLGIAEGVFSFTVIFILIVVMKKFIKASEIVGIKRFKSLTIFSIGALTGFLIQILSPGNIKRRNSFENSVNDLSSLVVGFRSSSIAFIAEALTHPMFYIMILLGLRYIRYDLNSEIVRARLKYFIIFSMLNFSMLVFAGTFSYVAWWHSTGFLLLLSPLGLCIGMLLQESISSIKFLKIQSNLLIFMSILMILLIIRVTFLAHRRSIDFETRLNVNYCLLKQNKNNELVGSEITYPPFNLGIEDIETWRWMRSSYEKWLLNPEFKREVKCAQEGKLS
jgi:hypothetical protein